MTLDDATSICDFSWPRKIPVVPTLLSKVGLLKTPTWTPWGRLTRASFVSATSRGSSPPKRSRIPRVNSNGAWAN
eukprot:1214428-Pyramimonas_sp.AAC.1